ncbi:MAG: EVE domain-containing protein, partial [Lachnospiraceae bacterium]|nr:EVE domain-containing protein [Lachnospiraceae bacterium]
PGSPGSNIAGGNNHGHDCVSGTNPQEPDINRDFSENLIIGNKLYDTVRAVLKTDTDFIGLYRSRLDASCAEDPELRILTSDVCSYIASNFCASVEKDTVCWMPAGYDPEITKRQWIELLHDPKVFDEDALAVMARMRDNRDPISCNDLAQYYGKTKHYYNTQVTALAKRLIDRTASPVPNIEDYFSKMCSVMFEWRVSREFDEANMLWKLRPELLAALDEIDLSGIELYIDVVPRSRIKNYWLLNTNPKVWGFSHAAVGEVKAFTLYNDNGYKRRIFDNFLNAKEGDIVIGYESHPSNQIVGLGRVSAAHDDKYIYFEKTEGLASPIDYAVIRNNPELGKMEFFNNMQGSLFKVNQGEYDRIMDIIREENPLRDNTAVPKYTKADFLDEVYMSESGYDELVEVLKTKKNIILQGAPGVGKTFTANRLAYSIMGEKDRSHIEFVQFHQNYSYEDFMLGYRPTDSGFELKYGIFYRFCLLAGNRPDKDYFFIIDEINRGNMSRIFGELLMMIEADYRGTTTTLSYNGLSFMVPKNLYIIGMMNTADRSLALIDYALRRRFGFYEIGPRFTSDGFRKYQSSLASPQLDRLIGKVIELNREIENDPSLGRGFCIGHSYFCGREPGNCTTEWLNSVIDYDIVPTLREYWFDEPARTAKWERELKSAVEVMS